MIEGVLNCCVTIPAKISWNANKYFIVEVNFIIYLETVVNFQFPASSPPPNNVDLQTGNALVPFNS